MSRYDSFKAGDLIRFYDGMKGKWLSAIFISYGNHTEWLHHYKTIKCFSEDGKIAYVGHCNKLGETREFYPNMLGQPTENT